MSEQSDIPLFFCKWLCLSVGRTKNPALPDSPPAADRFSDIFPFRRMAFLPGGLFIS